MGCIGTDARAGLGRWAVVSGASRGIGRAFALEAARRGLDVVLIARSAADLEEVAGECRGLGVEARTAPADLGCEEGVAEALAEAAGLDVGLFVAAAGFGSSGPFLDQDPASEADMIDVNCRALLTMTHAIAGGMASRRRGALVLMSSIVAFQGVPMAANYAATKAYVQTLAEGLRRELAPRGVQVCACAPGPVDSGFAARARMTMGSTTPAEAVARGTMERLGRGTVRPGALSKVLG
ncbi:MAG: SDR family NAD(P)-dependent oxidoreductase, partial [Planctomycetota bacterium]